MPLIEHRSLHCRGSHFRVVAVKVETKSPLFACSDDMIFYILIYDIVTKWR